MDFCYSNSYISNLSNLGDLLTELEEDISEHIQELCSDIYRDLETEHDYLISKEAIIETLRLNEYEFDETGKIY